MTHPFRFLAPAALVLLLMIPSCSKPESPEPTQDQLERYYVNTFACNTMRNYYLWADEIADGLEAWKTDEEPVGKVRALRYKDSAGEEVDRWTRLYEDFDTFYNGVNGKRTSYGLSYKLYYTDKTRSRIMAVVTYTYAGGPARQAGLKRGDIILEVNGKTLTPDNYQQVSAGELSGGESVTLTFADGSRKTLESARLYEDPILLTRIFDCQGKKVGYLHYTSFTLDSCQQLIDLCRSFKGREVTELILDLRYNGGGYALTEEVLASMLAPEQEVLAGSILATEVYNSTLMEISGMQSTPLTMDYSIEDEKGKTLFSTRGANIGITRLYAIVDSGTASASESLLCELYPYLDIVLIGGRTHGKFCSGLMVRATDWYKEYADQLGADAQGKDYVAGWGLYVMYSRFADRDGVTRCMPNGLTPDYPVTDDPADGFQLGDPQESMLAVALELAGYGSPAPAPARRSRNSLPEEIPLEHPAFRIK
jgi:carboxyl-terminal processing protease